MRRWTTNAHQVVVIHFELIVRFGVEEVSAQCPTDPMYGGTVVERANGTGGVFLSGARGGCAITAAGTGRFSDSKKRFVQKKPFFSCRDKTVSLSHAAR